MVVAAPRADDMPSIRELKAELDRLGIDYSDCREKGELVAKLENAQPSGDHEKRSAESSAPAADGETPHPPAPSVPLSAEEDIEASLSKINNLLDTLPASLTLLNKKWSDTRSDKTRGQLRSVKEQLDATATRCSSERSWQEKLEEYNALAKEYKKLRDLPRNMNG